MFTMSMITTLVAPYLCCNLQDSHSLLRVNNADRRWRHWTETRPDRRTHPIMHCTAERRRARAESQRTDVAAVDGARPSQVDDAAVVERDARTHVLQRRVTWHARWRLHCLHRELTSPPPGVIGRTSYRRAHRCASISRIRDGEKTATADWLHTIV